MAFKGVRMSWDMLKRKTLLARLAASAASLACFMARVCSVTSRMPTSMWGWPGRLSLYMIFVIFAKYQAFFSFSSLSSRSRSAWDFLR